MAKAVIARPVVIESDEPIDVHAVLLRLKASFGSSYRFSIDGFIGASPELLVEVEGDVVRAHPLAGTTRTTGDPELDAKLAAELHASPKNRIEHEAAIAMVRDTLLPYCSYLDWAPEPSIVKVANVQHLGSQAEGRLSRPVATVTELVRALQPTPAVGGHPRGAAIGLITEVEGFERGCTAAPSAGSTDAGTAPGRCRSGAQNCRVTAVVRAWSRAGASWPTANPSASWPRPRPSSRRC